MKGSDYRKSIGFMIMTIILICTGFLLINLSFSFVLNNELGDIYWGIILPIIAFIVIIIFILATTTYLASWIYFVKLKGYSRWFGILGIIPVIGPLFLIIIKNKIPKEGKNIHIIITITAIIGMIIPIILLFSFSSFLSSLKKEIGTLNQDTYSSKSKLNAIVKGVNHEKMKK